jgi:hypothetical protein
MNRTANAPKPLAVTVQQQDRIDRPDDDHHPDEVASGCTPPAGYAAIRSVHRDPHQRLADRLAGAGLDGNAIHKGDDRQEQEALRVEDDLGVVQTGNGGQNQNRDTEHDGQVDQPGPEAACERILTPLAAAENRRVD